MTLKAMMNHEKDHEAALFAAKYYRAMTRAPNGADREKYNAYQREYKRRQREAARESNADRDRVRGVHGVADTGSASVPGGGGVGDNGLGREAAELGDVFGLPAAGRMNPMQAFRDLFRPPFGCLFLALPWDWYTREETGDVSDTGT